MKITRTQRIASMALSVLLTVAMFGGVDQLAGSPASSAVWAYAVGAARG